MRTSSRFTRLELQCNLPYHCSKVVLVDQALSKHITSLTSPLAGHSSSHLKSSRHFKEMVESVHVESDELGHPFPLL